MHYEIQDGEQLPRALTKFRKLVLRAGIIREHVAHLQYRKPSEQRRPKLVAAERRRAKVAQCPRREPEWGRR